METNSIIDPDLQDPDLEYENGTISSVMMQSFARSFDESLTTQVDQRTERSSSSRSNISSENNYLTEPTININVIEPVEDCDSGISTVVLNREPVVDAVSNVTNAAPMVESVELDKAEDGTVYVVKTTRYTSLGEMDLLPLPVPAQKFDPSNSTSDQEREQGQPSRRATMIHGPSCITLAEPNKQLQYFDDLSYQEHELDKLRWNGDLRKLPGKLGDVSSWELSKILFYLAIFILLCTTVALIIAFTVADSYNNSTNAEEMVMEFRKIMEIYKLVNNTDGIPDKIPHPQPSSSPMPRRGNFTQMKMHILDYLKEMNSTGYNQTASQVMYLPNIYNRVSRFNSFNDFCEIVGVC